MEQAEVLGKLYKLLEEKLEKKQAKAKKKLAKT